MIKKTIMITSIAVLIAVTSVATTMTMVQANPTGDLIDIIIDGVGADPQQVLRVQVGPGPEYSGLMDDFPIPIPGFPPVPLIPLEVDVDDGIILITFGPAHLTGYEIEDESEEVERTVTIENQFGEQILEVDEAELLFVPSEKDGEPSQLNLDHFKCYEAKGDAVDVTVDLFDQFDLEEDVRVGKPKLFCNPVDKNGEGIFDDTAHLTCYKIKDKSEEVERTVDIDNQFGGQELEVEEPELLCVPSVKLAVIEAPEDD